MDIIMPDLFSKENVENFTSIQGKVFDMDTTQIRENFMLDIEESLEYSIDKNSESSPDKQSYDSNDKKQTEHYNNYKMKVWVSRADKGKTEIYVLKLEEIDNYDLYTNKYTYETATLTKKSIKTTNK